jgi:hypothetical protein
MDKQNILVWDLELTPMQVYTWTLWPNFIGINQIIKTQEVMCFGARWYGKKNVIFKSTHHQTKQEMLDTIHALLDKADAVMSWNGQSFDTKHMNREFLEAGMAPPSPYKEIDLMRVAKSRFKMASNKLDHVSQILGVGKKTPHEGFQLWIDCMAGDAKAWRKMKQYQLQDVNLLVSLYEKLKPWIKNHPNMGIGSEVPACTNCGSENMTRRGYEPLTTGMYPKFQCKDCLKWMRGKTAVVAGAQMRSI